MRIGLREAIFLFVLVSTPLAAYAFVFEPRNEVIKKAEQEIEFKAQELERLAIETARSTDLQRANEQMIQSVRKVERRLPSRDQVESVYDTISDLARSHRMTMTDIKFGKANDSAGYMEKPLEVKATGDIDDFYLFLQDIEAADRITRMSYLKIKRSTNRDEADFISASFTLSIYFETD